MGAYATLYRLAWGSRTRMTGSHVQDRLHTLAGQERLPPERITELQWSKLQRLLASAYAHVPHYRRQFDRLAITPRDIRTPADFARLPLLTRSDFAQHGDDLVARNIRPGRLVLGSTGGSSGRPVRFRHDRAQVVSGRAAMLLEDRWAGHELGDRHAFVWGSVIDRQNRTPLRERLHNTLARNMFFDCFELDTDRLDEILAGIARFRPQLLTGYVKPLELLARRAIHGRKAVGSVGAVQTGAEPITPEQRAVIEHGFGARVFERYGGRDFGVVGAECEAHSGMHIFSPHVYVERLRAEGAAPGDPDEIIVTQLDNPGAPFIRYRTEDLGVFSERTCPCGRTWPILERVEGRLTDLLLGTNGRVLSGLFFPHFFKDLDVGEFLVIQEALGLLRVRLTGGPGYTAHTERRIREVVRHYLGDDTEVLVERVPVIDRGPSGKHRVAISRIDAQEIARRTVGNFPRGDIFGDEPGEQSPADRVGWTERGGPSPADRAGHE